jgi:CheY-like chemotaxis protein
MDHLRVLVVDDNHDAADTLAMGLGLDGFETCVAYDGEQAVAACLRHHPAVVVMDVNMPVMDGCEACRCIKHVQPGVVLVALTGNSEPAAVERARAAGFDAFMTKPVSIDALTATLEAVT